MWRFFSYYFSDKAGEIAKKQLAKEAKEITHKPVPPKIIGRIDGRTLSYEFVYATSVEKAEAKFPEDLVFLPVPEWMLEAPDSEMEGMTKHKGVYCLKSEARELANKYFEKLKEEGIV